jgi:hypothetical protein
MISILRDLRVLPRYLSLQACHNVGDHQATSSAPYCVQACRLVGPEVFLAYARQIGAHQPVPGVVSSVHIPPMKNTRFVELFPCLSKASASAR